MMRTDKDIGDEVTAKLEHGDEKTSGLGMRILIHAVWYLLIGPPIGLFGMLLYSFFFESLSNISFARIVFSVMPGLVPYAYLIGAVPALFTGALMAFIPESLRSRPLRITCAAFIGMLVCGVPIAVLGGGAFNAAASSRTSGLLDAALMLGGFAGGFTALITPKIIYLNLKEKIIP